MDIFDFSDGREGYYGEYGGVFLPEILHATIEELLECFRECKADPKVLAGLCCSSAKLLGSTDSFNSFGKS